MKKILSLSLSALLLSGCSWFNGNKDMVNNNPNTNGNNSNGNKPMTNGNNTNNSSKKGMINDVMDYFEKEGIRAENMSEIDQFDFAAHEGRMFEVNGETVYLYRLNTEDAKMKTWMDEIQKNKKVSVNQNGMDEEYSALINNDYLLVYKMGADIAPLDETFTGYKMK